MLTQAWYYPLCAVLYRRPGVRVVSVCRWWGLKMAKGVRVGVKKAEKCSVRIRSYNNPSLPSIAVILRTLIRRPLPPPSCYSLYCPCYPLL